MQSVFADAVVKFVVKTSAQYSNVQRIWIFGSRAKGNATLRSDYDLAFEWIEPAVGTWGELTGILREKNPTLCALDIVRLDQVSNELQRRILGEGILLYDNKSQAKLC